MNLHNLLRVTNLVQRQIARDYAFKSDLKIKWVRPEKIPCHKPEKSGDLAQLPGIDQSRFLQGYEASQELKNADALVQSLFRLENNHPRETYKIQKQNMLQELQRHALDWGSMEARLARMTARIRSWQEHMERKPKDVKVKVLLKELIDKRKKFLKYLRRWDYKRFEWVLEKLDLVYKPPPAHFHWITRKESLQKLTNLYCEDVRNKRLAEYRAILEQQQIPFLEQTVQKLQHVRREQIELELPVTVSEEHIAEAKKQLAELQQQREAALAEQRKHEESAEYY